MNQGIEYLVNARDIASIDNYNYYYHRVRKYALLRYYEEQGLDTRMIYDSTVVSSSEKEKEQMKFDNYTEQDIIEIVEASLVINPNMKYCTNTLSTNVQAADGMLELVNGYMEVPDVGMALNSLGLNTVSRGARKGCLFMRSCPQGGGKTRLAVADAATVAIPYVWNEQENRFDYTGNKEPTLFISTEMPVDEIQTILISSISKVNEEHILYGNYEEGEYERAQEAIKLIEQSPIYISHVPDFSIQDIKNLIKKFNREFKVEYFFFDYIHTSLRLISEITSKSGMGLKEHQLLLVFATELKTIAQQLDVFIFTASQLNGEAQNATYKDQNLLAGAKSLANKLDLGVVSMAPTKAELKKIEPVLHKMINMPVPNMCHWVYKVRRGRITRIIVWSWVNLGNMVEKCLFVTNYDFELIEMDFTKIEQVEEKIREHSIPISKVEDVIEGSIDIVTEDVEEDGSIVKIKTDTREMTW